MYVGPGPVQDNLVRPIHLLPVINSFATCQKFCRESVVNRHYLVGML